MCLNPLVSYQPNRMPVAKPLKDLTLIVAKGITKKNITLLKTRSTDCGWSSLLQHPSITFLKFYIMDWSLNRMYFISINFSNVMFNMKGSLHR